MRQVCDGGSRARFGISRETVALRPPRCRASCSSPWILGAPHRGFIAVMFLMRAVISALIGGRPTRGRPESLVQCSRKRRRCHRRTVSGDTMTRACLQPAQTLASPTHEAIHRAQSGPRHRSFVHGELLTQGEVLQGELAVAAAEEREESNQVEHEGDHHARILSGSELIDQPLAHRMEVWRRTTR